MREVQTNVRKSKLVSSASIFLIITMCSITMRNGVYTLFVKKEDKLLQKEELFDAFQQFEPQMLPLILLLKVS